MKLSAKPISSPGRTDKFPPPLMRFLRSNAGSRSRGRSRSSPMFLRKKNTTAIETQDPSSPKVTCMGQVRVRRSSKQAAAKRGRPTPATAAATEDGAPTKCRCRCWWVPNALFSHHLATKTKPGSSCHCHCQPVWPNWGWFFRRKASTKVREASMKTELNFRGRSNHESEHEHEEEESEYEERVNDNAFVSNSNSSSTPPRNALLLTRCRSAPYRSSSLASRFWGSPLRREETGEEQGTELENRESTENEKPGLQSQSFLDQEGIKDPKLERKLRFFKELEDSLRERIMESEKGHELKSREGSEGDSAGPLVLTRCKSEPARTAQKLHPEVNNFWKKRRSGFADTCSPHGL